MPDRNSTVSLLNTAPRVVAVRLNAAAAQPHTRVARNTRGAGRQLIGTVVAAISLSAPVDRCAHTPQAVH
jgi:hypothetical protein